MDPKITKKKVFCNWANLKFYFAVLVLVYLIMESMSIELDNHIIFQRNQKIKHSRPHLRSQEDQDSNWSKNLICLVVSI